MVENSAAPYSSRHCIFGHSFRDLFQHPCAAGRPGYPGHQIICRSHRVPAEVEFRLALLELSSAHEPRICHRLLQQVPGRTSSILTTADETGESTTGCLKDAIASPLPVQHVEFDFRAAAEGSRNCGLDDRAAGRLSANDLAQFGSPGSNHYRRIGILAMLFGN